MTLLLRSLHLLFMGLWVAAGMYVAGDVRRTMAAGPEHLPLLRDRVRRASRFTSISGAATLLSGLGLILALGGFAAVPPAIHVGFVATLVLAVLGAKGVGVPGRRWPGRWRTARAPGRPVRCCGGCRS
jgi:hypothetical protein